MTHVARFQARLSAPRASLTRHGLLRSNKQIIFITAFNNSSTDLLCSADTSQNSVAADHSTSPSASL